MTDYTELKRLALAATPGTWERGDGNEVSVSADGDEGYWSWEVAGPAQVHGAGDQRDKDADFIVAANPAAVLALIAENEALRKDAERYRFVEENPDIQIEYTGELTLSQYLDAAMGKGEQS